MNNKENLLDILTKEEEMKHAMTCAGMAAEITGQDIFDEYVKSGLVGIYDLGMRHMYEYLKNLEKEGN